MFDYNLIDDKDSKYSITIPDNDDFIYFTYIPRMLNFPFNSEIYSLVIENIDLSPINMNPITVINSKKRRL